MLKEFKEFAIKGSVVDLAVGVIIGAAFGKLVTSLVEDIVMPPLGLLLNKVDFTNLFVSLSGGPFATLDEAKKAGAPTINFGIFINNVVNFVIVAFVIFLFVRQINILRRQTPPPPPNTRECPFCATAISNKATRCPNCTSQLQSAA